MTPSAITSFRGEYAFLSNFAPCFAFAGGTLETSYQAAKFTCSPDIMAQIVDAPTPGKAKRLAARWPHLVRPDWQRVRTQVMWCLLCEKFDPVFEPKMTALLQTTNDALLIEGNQWHDTYWGVCFRNTCGGHGKNILGLLLMERRDQINGCINS